MSDLSAMLDAQVAAREAIQPTNRPQQLVKSVKFGNVAEIARALALKVCEVYELTPNNDAVTNAGTNGAGDPTVLFALKREKNALRPAASVTIYGRGSVTFAGCDPIDELGNPIPA